MDDSWTCHVCGEERPDAKISVFKSDRSAQWGLPPGSISQNVRYCNDRQACIDGAKNVEFVKGGSSPYGQR